MPMTRKTIADNTTRQKIVDDPDNPGNPLNVAPANVKRLQHELDKLAARADFELGSHDDQVEFRAQGVLDTLAWLQDLTKPSPLDPELPHG